LEKAETVFRGKLNISVSLGNLEKKEPSEKNQKNDDDKDSPDMKTKIYLLLSGQALMRHRTSRP